MKTVLVTGGAGYLGAHICLRLAQAGYRPVVFDNLYNGHAEFVQWGPLEVGDIRDAAHLDVVMTRYSPVAVLHFAAMIEVGESTKYPGRFFENNVSGSVTLIEAAHRHGVEALVFSSTCATFGAPVTLPMAESHPQVPLNPYGRSKLLVEQMLSDYSAFVGFRSTVLRYFNAAGADFEARIGELHEPETHAIPIAMEVAQGKRASFSIFGSDYETRDGTAVRDYVHVLDLADAHLAALERMLGGGATTSFNLGTGEGTTVRELVDGVEAVTGVRIPTVMLPRRVGDAASLVADSAKARAELGWYPKRDLHQILSSAWKWHESVRTGAVFPERAALRLELD